MGSGNASSGCIVLAGDATLRYGDALRLMQLWRTEPRNAVINVEPSVDWSRLLAPFTPLDMQAHHVPIDTRLKPGAARRLLRECAPKRVAAPASIASLLNETTSSSNTRALLPVVLTPGDVVSVPLDHTSTQLGYVSSALAASLQPISVPPSLLNSGAKSYAAFVARASDENGTLQLDVVNNTNTTDNTDKQNNANDTRNNDNIANNSESNQNNNQNNHAKSTLSARPSVSLLLRNLNQLHIGPIDVSNAMVDISSNNSLQQS